MQALLQAYEDMPPVTRIYTTACVLTTLAVQLDFVTPFHLYFNWDLIIYDYQFWRLLTSFCFFGSFGFSFLFNMIFTYRYCMMLEEDYLWYFCTYGISWTGFYHYARLCLEQKESIRTNEFFGVLSFNAPYLPWVLLLFSLLLGNNAIVDFMGIACGHFYFFLEDVFPLQQNGFRVLQTPQLLKWLLDPVPVEPVDVDERPGGFNWGEQPPRAE
ncbi:Derlin-2 [Dirofilaria immitis]|nr:Derlin-2 [Dirofilaria immitis]